MRFAAPLTTVLVSLLLANSVALAQCPRAIGLGVNPTVCGIELVWQNSPGAGPATGWAVYRNTAPFIFGASIITTTSANTLTFTDVPPQRGVTYYYFVAGLATNCPINGTLSGVVSTQLPPQDTPDYALASYPDCNQVNLEWSLRGGATSARITLELASGAVISDFTSTSFSALWMPTSNTSQLPAKAKVYAVAPCGVQSDPIIIDLQFRPPAAQPLAFTASSDQPCAVRLDWTPSPLQTNGHRIERRSLASSTPVSFDVPTGSTFTDTTAAPGVQYEYTLFAQAGCSSGDVMFPLRSIGTAVANASVTYLAPAKAPRSGTATLTLPANVASGATSFSWRKGVTATGAGGTPVANSARVSGATSPSLTITGITPDDADLYALTIQRPCGTETRVAALTVTNPCPADFDGSGTRDVADIFAFLSAWFAGCP